jgi:flagellar basal-body rod modification protein FlgD
MSSIDLTMSQADRFQTETLVDSINKQILNGRSAQSNELDKDDFLKILITQLQYQDPSDPMKDKEFIAQMAQFSSLEQMTNMSSEFGKLSQVLSSTKASNLLGREVDVETISGMVTGKVEEIQGREYPQLKINGKYYDAENVLRIRE